MPEPLVPLYVRIAAPAADRLSTVAAASGRSKRALIEDAVREHLADDGLVVGRVARLSDDGLVVGQVALREPVPEVLTAGEAAALLRIDEPSLVLAAGAGELPGRRLGDEWRFSKAALLAWLGAPVADVER